MALRCVCVPWRVACAVLSGSSAVSRCMATVYLARLDAMQSYSLFSPNCQPMYPLAMSGMCTPEIVVEKNRLACLHLRCCGFGCGNRSGRCDAEAKAWMHTSKSNLEVKCLLCNVRSDVTWSLAHTRLAHFLARSPGQPVRRHRRVAR